LSSVVIEYLQTPADTRETIFLFDQQAGRERRRTAKIHSPGVQMLVSKDGPGFRLTSGPAGPSPDADSRAAASVLIEVPVMLKAGMRTTRMTMKQQQRRHWRGPLRTGKERSGCARWLLLNEQSRM
jgi:hypothetical protein